MLGHEPVVAEVAHRLDDRQERLALLRQLVLDPRRRLGVALPQDDPLDFECAESFRERPRADPRQGALEVREPARALGEVVDEDGRPLRADDVRGARHGAVLVVDGPHRAHVLIVRLGQTGDDVRMSSLRVGIDVGGTFTDLVAVADGRIVIAKVPSTPADQSEGVLRALESAGLAPGEVVELRHGTTVATNALLERRGARTALVTTEGFRDILEIGRQNRPSLYDLTRDRPPPLVPRERRFTVRERTGPEGVLEPLDEASVGAAVAALGEARPEAVAVCLLFGYLHPEHERRVGAALRRALPGVQLTLASEVLPAFREYERTATTAATAYLGPGISDYLGRLAERLGEAGYPAPLVMQSSGGVATAEEAAERAAAVVLSGPAGGAVGAARVAALEGFPDALTLDLGGTSADVALVRGGEVATASETVVAGVPIALPAVDVHSVSAGGGSIAWADEGGALRVGPRSAGAEPGPAAYGRGGEEPTVTDAALALGLLADGATLAGTVTLRRDLAEAALARLGEALGLGVEDTALGVLRVANAETARALRVMSVERGIDPRGLALVAFGGAGPMHACPLAEELGMRRVLVPRASGVLSALGLAVTEARRDRSSPFLARLDELDETDLDRRFVELEAEAAAGLPGAALERSADLRYRGQGFELTVPACDPAGLAERFAKVHEERYGYRLDAPVEVVAVRVTARAHAPETRLPDGESEGEVQGARLALLGGTWVEAPDRRGHSGDRRGTGDRRAPGIDLRCRARLARRRRSRGHARPGADMTLDPVTLTVLASALAGIAEEMGALLVRGALSPNIKERRDCSTALFDAAGRLVAQAAHIPVHLGAMPEAVAAVRERDPGPVTSSS